MPTITKTFSYTGTKQTSTVPAGAQSVEVHLWGGAGGGGGGDRAGPGRSGSAGHYVTATIDLTSNANDEIVIGVGGGGAGGSSGGNAAGGRNGKSLTGYSGGTGGNSGPGGSSGAGGGGGGATVITIAGSQTAVAGGGGGGAGDGLHSQGTVASNSNTPTSGTPGTLGENGAGHSGDGGGGGAGGGGSDGGTGGNGGSGDNGGTGGTAGSNDAAGGTENNGSGRTPGGTSSQYYTSGVAVGGSASASGGNGKAVLIFNIGVETKFKTTSGWKDITQMYFKKDVNVWKQITAAYIKTASGWKAIFNSGVNFVASAAGFGDNGGNPASGTQGSGGGGGGRVICTWLTERGMFSEKDLAIDTEYSVKYISRTVKIGYWFWAVPLVAYMTKSERTNSWFGSLVIRTIRALAQARANELSYAMGVTGKRDALGIVTRLVGESFCFAIGFVARPFVEKKFTHWLQIYDPQGN